MFAYEYACVVFVFIFSCLKRIEYLLGQIKIKKVLNTDYTYNSIILKIFDVPKRENYLLL